MRDTLLKKWLQSQKMIITDKNKEFSHLCLDGGKLMISIDNVHYFYEQYAKNYELESYFICEYLKGDQVRKFYCDFDIIFVRPIGINELGPYIQIMYDIIKKYFNYDSTIICCSTQPRTKKMEDGNYKTGIHFIWKDFFVTKDISKVIAMFIIQEFKKYDKENSEEVLGLDWDNVVDLQVYNNGLRMIGSRKIARKKNNYVEDKRMYMPECIFPKDESYMDGNMFKYLCDCSIINYYNGSIFEPKERIPIDIAKEEKPAMIIEDIPDYNKKVKLIKDFIRMYCPKQWCEDIVSIKFINNHYTVFSKSRYCLNIGKEHNAKVIYFKIYKTGLQQLCTCRCKGLKGGKKVECSKYSSKKYKLTKDIYKKLFPNEKVVSSRYLHKIDYEQLFPTNKNLTLKNLDIYLKESERTINYLKKKYLD